MTITVAMNRSPAASNSLVATKYQHASLNTGRSARLQFLIVELKRVAIGIAPGESDRLSASLNRLPIRTYCLGGKILLGRPSWILLRRVMPSETLSKLSPSRSKKAFSPSGLLGGHRVMTARKSLLTSAVCAPCMILQALTRGDQRHNIDSSHLAILGPKIF